MVKLYKYIGSVDNFGAYQDIFVAQRMPWEESTPQGQTQPWRHMRKFVKPLMPYGATFTGLNPNWSRFLEYMNTIPQADKDLYAIFVTGTPNVWYSELFTDCRQCKKKYEEYSPPTFGLALKKEIIQPFPFTLYRIYIDEIVANIDFLDDVEYFDVFTTKLHAGILYDLLHLYTSTKSNPTITPEGGGYRIQQTLCDISCMGEIPPVLKLWAWERNFKVKNIFCVGVLELPC